MEEALKCDVKVELLALRAGMPQEKYAAFLKPELPEAFSLPEKLFEKIAQTETSQGIIAVVKKKTWEENAFFRCCGEKNILVLDRLQDPGNIGTMLRTADAAGYGGAIAIKGTGDLYSPKVVRAASGSLFRMPVFFTEHAEETLSLLRSKGKKTVATSLSAVSAYYDADLEKNIALLIGNEGSGLSRQLMEGADEKIRIPMEGNIESLNASVAAGILMYESRRPKRPVQV